MASTSQSSGSLWGSKATSAGGRQQTHTGTEAAAATLLQQDTEDGNSKASWEKN